MFIFAFFISLCVITLINNKQKDIDEENSDSYSFDKRSSLIIIGVFLVGVAMQYIMPKFKEYYFYGLGGYLALSIIFLIISNALRVQAIEKERSQIDQIYEILSTLLKVDKNGIDYNNVPFKLVFDPKNKSYIQEINLTMENPDKFTDSAITQAVYSLNKFFPYKQWINETDYPERECKFIGNKLPPDIANFPGSDLRPWNFIPLGLNGNGELGWNLGVKKKNIGESLYVYEDSKEKAGTVETPKAPQALCVGSTGGGKAIALNQSITIYRET